MKNLEYYFFCILNDDKYVLHVVRDIDWKVFVLHGDDDFVEFEYVYDYKNNIDDIVEKLRENFDMVCEIDESEKNDFV